MGQHLNKKLNIDLPDSKACNTLSKLINNLKYYVLGGIVGIALGIAFILSHYAILSIVILALTLFYFCYVARLFLKNLHEVKHYIIDILSVNKQKESIINAFSHRIREPLNNIMILIGIMKESDCYALHTETINNIDNSSQNIVNAVNELTMQSAGNIILESRVKIRFNLFSTIQNTIDLYNLKKKNFIKFNLTANEYSNIDCMGDPIIIKQIILDVIEIIDKATKSTVEVSISLQIQELSSNKYLMGFTLKSDFPIVLVNEDNPMSSLTARLVSYSKGTYSQVIETNYSALNILLPIERATDKVNAPFTSQKIEEIIHKGKQKKEIKDIKVLLAEDNPINQKITMMTLKPLVKEINTAENGKEALELFDKTNYDVVLMDIQMPVMDGLTASMKIRELETSTGTHVPIIAITANAMLGDKEKCLDAGIDEYISKPFQPAYLIEKIKKLI